MEKVMLLNWVAVIICPFVRESRSTCVEGINEVVEGVLGGNANISCEIPSGCGYILWEREYNTGTMGSSQETNNQTSSYGIQRPSFHRISPITSDDFGIHSCWCYKNGTKSDNSPVCTVTLTPICHSKVKANGETIFYNSSQRSSVPKFLNVTEGEKIKVKCCDNATASMNCGKRRDVNRKDGVHYSYKLTISLRHNSCSIVCNLNHDGNQICNVNVTLHVSKLDTTTQIPPGPTKFPVAILVSIFAIFLVTVSFAFHFWKSFLRSRCWYRSNKEIRKYPSSRSRYRRDQNYETVDLSSTTFAKEHANILDQGACDNDHVYYDIKDVKDYHDITHTESTSHQPLNSPTTDTSFSRDFKFVVQESIEKDVENHEFQKCDEFHLEATNEEWVKGEDKCDPINKVGHQQKSLTKGSSGDGNGKLEVFYAVLENDQDC